MLVLVMYLAWTAQAVGSLTALTALVRWLAVIVPCTVVYESAKMALRQPDPLELDRVALLWDRCIPNAQVGEPAAVCSACDQDLPCGTL